MRLIKEAFDEIKRGDPQTALTKTALRRMVKSGEVPSIKINSKYLLNLDVLISYLNNPAPSQAKIITVDGVRKVPEKLNYKAYKQGGG